MRILYSTLKTRIGGAVGNVTYTATMALIARTATIQARVFPGVKEASERVLWRMGLNMSEAMELFLRRVIVDEGIPFDIVALDEGQFAGEFIGSASGSNTDVVVDTHASRMPRSKRGGNQKTFSKVFSQGSTNSESRGRKSAPKQTH